MMYSRIQNIKNTVGYSAINTNEFAYLNSEKLEYTALTMRDLIKGVPEKVVDRNHFFVNHFNFKAKRSIGILLSRLVRQKLFNQTIF